MKKLMLAMIAVSAITIRPHVYVTQIINNTSEHLGVNKKIEIVASETAEGVALEPFYGISPHTKHVIDNLVISDAYIALIAPVIAPALGKKVNIFSLRRVGDLFEIDTGGNRSVLGRSVTFMGKEYTSHTFMQDYITENTTYTLEISEEPVCKAGGRGVKIGSKYDIILRPNNINHDVVSLIKLEQEKKCPRASISAFFEQARPLLVVIEFDMVVSEQFRTRFNAEITQALNLERPDYIERRDFWNKGKSALSLSLHKKITQEQIEQALNKINELRIPNKA
jgi:hypothetical protein